VREVREVREVPVRGVRGGYNACVDWAARDAWFDVNGVRLYALESGPSGGPLAILLHGFPESSGAWHAQAPALAAAGFHVVAPDQRGYARSSKPRGARAYVLDTLAADVVALADACGARTFSLAGHDWGGVVAWWVGLHHPERVERLAVLNAPHPVAFAQHIRRSPTQLARSWYMFAFQLPGLPERLLASDDARPAFRALVDSSRPGTFDEDDAVRYREAWSQPGAWTGMVNWYRAAFRHPSRLRVPPRLRVPTLILWGDRDRFLGPGLADDSVGFCDDGRLVRFPQATHWIQHEEAARVSQELVGFFRHS
jgi:pimeloyl-ACP methyl ester carboxylesterase